MGQVVTDRLVEILAADAAREPAVVDDEDTALPVALAERHRVADGRLGLDGARRSRHHVSCERRRASRCPQGVDHALARDGEALPRDRGRRLRVTASAERRGDDGRVDSLRPAPDDGEHALVHLHEQDERPRVRQVDDLVREVRDAVDVLGPAHRREVDVVLRRVDGSSASMRCCSELRSAGASGVWRYSFTRSWRAPWRRHQERASTSRCVVVA